MRKRIRRLVMKAGLLFVVLPLGMVVNVQAASFDCAKISSKTGKMICADAELSKLEEELVAAYEAALHDESRAESVRKAQKAWLLVRDVCNDISCVKAADLARIEDLKNAQKTTPVPTQSKQPTKPTAQKDDEACLAPKIDWRNYEWILITGNGKTACEEMLAYLKSRPRDIPPPVCPEDRLPPNANWTRPEWKDVSPLQEQRFLTDIPKKGQESIKAKLERGRLMTTRTDITRDGDPENLLAVVSFDRPGLCHRSSRCALFDGNFKGFIRLEGDLYYDLLPLNEEGTEIDWQSKAIGGMSTLVFGLGELIYYKGRPYWLSHISWNQGINDNFQSYKNNPNDPYSNIFELAPLVYGKIDNSDRESPTHLDNISYILPDKFANCHFGYFHRDNLKQNPPTERR